MLTRQRANRRCDTALIALASSRAHRHFRAFLELDVLALPPVQLRAQVNVALVEPLLVPQRREEVRAGELLLYALYGRVAQVVVVVVTYDHEVYCW